MPPRLSTILSLTAAAALAVAVLVSLRELPRSPTADQLSGTASAAVADVHSSIAAADPRSATTPDGGNVSHEFRAEVAALEGRLNDAPGDTLALGRLGALLHMAHQPVEAIPYLERYTAINQKNREVWLQLVTSYAAVENWDKAVEATMAMLAGWPDDPEAMYNLGAIHANQGDFKEARRWWKKVGNQGSDAALADRATVSLGRLPIQ